MSLKFNVILICCFWMLTCSQSEIKAQAPLKILFTKNPPASAHTCYIELVGLAIPASINYDLILMRYKGWGLSGRIGYGYFPGLKDSNEFTENSLVAGLQIHYQWGRHGIELGWGSYYAWTRYFEEPDTIYRFQDIYYSLSYRLQNPKGGFFLKATLYALDNYYSDSSFRFQPIEGTFGISLGYTFRSRKE